MSANPSPGAAPWLALLLASLAALAPFSIDTYLPSFPEIGLALKATPLEVQQTLSFYLLAYAAMALWHGAISDALGRRRVILWTLTIYALVSLCCAFVTRIEQLWALRIAQGLVAGAGAVVGRAVVRDLFDGPPAQRLMSHVSMTFAIAPAIAPVIGGWLHTGYGWRSIFYFLVLIALVLWFACWRWLPETLPPHKRQSLHPGYLASTYWRVLTSPKFLAISLAGALNFAGFFVYVLSAPVFVLQHLGLSETEFLWLFGPAMGGLMFGSWISSRLAGVLASRSTVVRAYLLMGLAATANIGISAFLAPGLPWSVIPLFFYTVGMALAMPTLTIAGLDLFPLQRGLASSCQTFLHTAASAIIAGALVPLLWGSTLYLALGMAALLVGGALNAMIYATLVGNGFSDHPKG